MSQAELNSAIARATGETLETIRRRGFSPWPPCRRRSRRPPCRRPGTIENPKKAAIMKQQAARPPRLSEHRYVGGTRPKGGKHD